MTTNNFRVRKGLTIAGETSGSSSFNNSATGSDLAYTLPTAQGASSTVLTNDGTGVLSWALPGGGGSTFGNITVGVETDNTISTTTGNLVLNSVSGTIQMNSNGTLGFTLTPISGFNPNADFTGNIIKGSIRTGAGESNGNIYEFVGSTFPSTGISIDNTDKPADRTSIVLRNYGASLTGGLPRANILMESARGTAASPTNIGNNDNLAEIQATGYTSTGWISDQVNAPAGLIRIRAAESFTNGINNVGTSFQVILQPTATTLTTGGGSLIPTFTNNPQGTTIRSDNITFFNKAGTTTASLDSTGKLIVNGNISTLGTTTFNNELAVNAVSELLSTNTSAGTTVGIQTNYRTGSGGTLVVPQNSDSLGNFRFNSYSDAAGSYVLASQVYSQATENWTPTANGSRLQFFANKQGLPWTTGLTSVLNLSPENSTYTSDSFTFNNTSTSLTASLNSSGDLTLTGDLRINGNDIKASDGNIAETLVPITGYNPNVDFTGNIVKGSIRDSAVQANGDIWQAFGPSGQSTGISIDNTDKVTDRTSIVMRNYGASLAGAVPRNTIVGEAARGTAATPLNLTNGVAIFDVLGTGYTSTGWITDSVNSVPAVLRLTTTETWNNGLNNVGTGFQFLAQPTATTLTAGGASLIPVITANPQTFNLRSDNYNWGRGKTNNASMANLFMDGANHTTFSLNQTRATNGNEFAVSNFTTQRSTDGINYTPTQSGDVIGAFKFNGNAYTSTTPGVPFGPGAQIYATATENWTSTANGTRFSFNANKTGTIDGYDVIRATPDLMELSADIIRLRNFDGSSTKLQVNTTYTESFQPFKFPVYTAAAANAITGAVGWQICISDSASGGNPNGMMAFWDTTHSRWSYIHDNSAV